MNAFSKSQGNGVFTTPEERDRLVELFMKDGGGSDFTVAFENIKRKYRMQGMLWNVTTGEFQYHNIGQFLGV